MLILKQYEDISMNKKTIRKIFKISAIIFLFALAITLWTPSLYILLFFGLCGLWDVLRNRPINSFLLKRYFLGNGLLTFLLSPLNLIADFFCFKNHKVYRYEDYPAAWQTEIKEILALFDTHKKDIMADLNTQMDNKRRGMIFYKWFDDNMSEGIPAFHKDFKYIKTIGVSVFNPHQSTSWHFGPLRFSYRILYNLLPAKSEKAYITTMGKKYYWKDNAFFSFDDTLLHKSVNETDQLRYCAFIDVTRPSPMPAFLNRLIDIVGFFMKKSRGVFYKNWDVITPLKNIIPKSF